MLIAKKMKESSETHIEIDWHVILGDRDRRVAMSGSLMTIHH
jgi:hypothetical protein